MNLVNSEQNSTGERGKRTFWGSVFLMPTKQKKKKENINNEEFDPGSG